MRPLASVLDVLRFFCQIKVYAVLLRLWGQTNRLRASDLAGQLSYSWQVPDYFSLPILNLPEWVISKYRFHVAACAGTSA